MKLSLCLEMLFTDWPFADRIAVASRLGYKAVEFWDWRDKDLSAVEVSAAQNGVAIAAMSGNRRHSLIDPKAGQGLTDEMEEVFEAASRLNCRHIMMLSDVLSRDGSAAPAPDLPAEKKTDAIVENLQKLAGQPMASGFTLLLEPLNTALDHRGCFLNNSALGVEIVRRLNTPRVRLLYDIYHMSMMKEDVLVEIKKNLDWIGYFHVADMPGRHQPGTGGINYPAVNGLLRGAGYEGFVGMEFSAMGSDEQAAATALRVFC